MLYEVITMMTGKGMPPEVRALLERIGIGGVEDEARRLAPEAVEAETDVSC